MRIHPFAVCLFWVAAGRAEKLPIQSYTTADGLADNHINRIRQDSRGFLWFATDEGLSRFDGQVFRTYTTVHGLPHPWVNDLIESRDGNYYVATDGGVCLFDSTGSGSSSLFVCQEPGPNKGARRVNSLAEDSGGGIWCATYDGIYRIERRQREMVFRHVGIEAPVVSEGFQVNNLLLDRRGALWAASSTGLYRRLANGRWERYTTAHGLPHIFVETLLEDRAGRLWAGMRHEGFCLLVSQPDPARRIVERCYSERDGLRAGDVRSILQTSDGRLWIGTVDGLSQLTPSNHIVTYTTAHGLSDQVIYKLAEDREGNLWIGTKNAGVMRLDPRGFVSYGEADGFRPGDYVSSLFETPTGELCVTTGAYTHRLIQCFDGRRFAAIEPAIPSRLWKAGWGWEENTLLDRDGNWWLPTAEGLFRVPPVRHIKDLSSARPQFIRSIGRNAVGRLYQDARGDIWIAASRRSSSQLNRLERSSGTIRPFARAPASESAIASAFAQDASGRLWIGFRKDGGLVRCAPRPHEDCDNIEEAPRGDIHALLTDSSGRVWAGSSTGGLGRCDHPADPRPRFVLYTTSSGLSSNEVWCMAEDRSGRIYAGTSRGVDRIDPASGHIRHFTAADGLGEGRIQAAYRDRRGRIWVATHKSVSYLDPPPAAPHSPPIVRITGFRVGGVARPLSEFGETQIGPLGLAASENSLQIEFAGLKLGGGRNLLYQTILEGAGDHWTVPEDVRTALFPHVAPGSYRFLVRALDADGVASPEPASLIFSIAPPLWQRWWFFLVAVTAALLLAWSLHRHRLARAVDLERIRSRIAIDLHDEIGSSLSRMAVLSEVVQRQIGPTAHPGSQRLLAEIAASARGLVDGMADIVWSINPGCDNLGDLTARVRQFASEMLETAGIRWEFVTPLTLDHQALSPDQRRELYLIFKEAVTNLVRHSRCSSALLSLEISDRYLIARIHDDGRGLAPNGPRGRGLTNIQTRTHRLRGRCEIISEPNRGTKINVEVPLRT